MGILFLREYGLGLLTQSRMNLIDVIVLNNVNCNYISWQAELETVHTLYSTLFNYMHYWKQLQLYEEARQLEVWL